MTRLRVLTLRHVAGRWFPLFEPKWHPVAPTTIPPQPQCVPSAGKRWKKKTKKKQKQSGSPLVPEPHVESHEKSRWSSGQTSEFQSQTWSSLPTSRYLDARRLHARIPHHACAVSGLAADELLLLFCDDV